MESSIYGYYYVSTDCLSNKWDTNEIERFILAYGDFNQKGYGDFRHKTVFCTINLMDVKSYDSWNNSDYNDAKTNYICIVTTKEVPAIIKKFFKDFEFFLGWHICEEDDDIILTKSKNSEL